MYLLDTNVVSELRKIGDGKADPNVLSWVRSIPVGSMFLSAITILELETGVLRIERRDAPQGAMLRAWLEGHVLPTFRGRILSVDTEVALRSARMHVPSRRAALDALIAATALVNGMTVVTRNVTDFRSLGVPLLNPWDAGAKA